MNENKSMSRSDYEYYGRIIREERARLYCGKPLSKILDTEYDLDKEVNVNYSQAKEMSAEKLAEEIRKTIKETLGELRYNDLNLRAQETVLGINVKWNKVEGALGYLVFVNGDFITFRTERKAFLACSEGEHAVRIVAVGNGEILKSEVIKCKVSGIKDDRKLIDKL